MKPSMFAFFFLFAFISSSAKAFILDSDGEPVVNGGKYHILSLISVAGGGVDLDKTGNETCPLSVVQRSTLPGHATLWGIPWTISSPVRSRFIPANVPVDFFSVEGIVPNCVSMPSKWTVVEEEDGIKYVKITGYENTVKGSFKIEPYSQISYSFSFCSTESASCENVGRIGSGLGFWGLIISGEFPAPYVFVKAESSGVDSKKLLNNVLEA